MQKNIQQKHTYKDTQSNLSFSHAGIIFLIPFFKKTYQVDYLDKKCTCGEEDCNLSCRECDQYRGCIQPQQQEEDNAAN